MAWILGFWVPALLLGGAALLSEKMPDKPEPVIFETLDVESPEISVLTEDGTVRVMELEDYLIGVVLAEMPASFEREALKAQAVVARTYSLRSRRHADANVCMDSTCCQAYISPTDYLAAGGAAADATRVAEAVLETEGQVLTYQGELIEATYFSCSGGTTEDAAAVWGTEVAYLRATVSPGEEEASHYRDTIVLTWTEFAKKLGFKPEGDPRQWIAAPSYTNGGGIERVMIAGREYTGVMLRQLLELPSTACTFFPGEGSVQITTRGYGHRVGMSQYGADAMAAQGCDYQTILSHYYPETTLESRNGP